MTESNLELKKLMLLSARPKDNVLLSDLIRYEKATGDSMGRDIKIIQGEGNPTVFIEPLENMYHEVSSPKEITNESIRVYLKEVAWVAASEIKSGNIDKIRDLFLTFEKSLTIANGVTQRLAIDFLEDFQTLYINFYLNQEILDSYILPQTKLWWTEIKRVWDSAANWAKENPEVNSKRQELLGTVKGYLLD